MESKAMLRGMANVSYWADDVKEARKWYAELFGMEPYFQRPDCRKSRVHRIPRGRLSARGGDHQQKI